MKTDVWLDTTALVDLEFRSAALRQHILSLFPQGSTRRTSRYVLFELARGVLRHLIRLHNKAAEARTLADLIQYIGNCNVGSRRAASTMFNAYQDFLRDSEATDGPLTQAGQLEEFRSWLAPHIRRRWQRARSLSTENPMGCQPDLPAPQFQPASPPDSHLETITHDLPSRRCGQPDNCALIASMQRRAGDFLTMTTALDALPQKDEETTARIPALQRLLAQPPAQPFQRKDCYRCADAIIVSEAPAGATILSKNEKHFRPLCDALAKPLQTYTEPKPATRPVA